MKKISHVLKRTQDSLKKTSTQIFLFFFNFEHTVQILRYYTYYFSHKQKEKKNTRHNRPICTHSQQQQNQQKHTTHNDTDCIFFFLYIPHNFLTNHNVTFGK